MFTHKKKCTINKTNFALATSTGISFQCKTNAEKKTKTGKEKKNYTGLDTAKKTTFYKWSVNIQMSKHTLPPVFVCLFFSFLVFSEITTASSWSHVPICFYYLGFYLFCFVLFFSERKKSHGISSQKSDFPANTLIALAYDHSKWKNPKTKNPAPLWCRSKLRATFPTQFTMCHRRSHGQLVYIKIVSVFKKKKLDCDFFSLVFFLIFFRW